MPNTAKVADKNTNAERLDYVKSVAGGNRFVNLKITFNPEYQA